MLAPPSISANDRLVEPFARGQQQRRQTALRADQIGVAERLRLVAESSSPRPLAARPRAGAGAAAAAALAAASCF